MHAECDRYHTKQSWAPPKISDFSSSISKFREQKGANHFVLTIQVQALQLHPHFLHHLSQPR